MAGDDITITAKAVLDASEFAAGAAGMKSDIDEIKSSASEMSESLQESASGIQKIGEEGGQAASGLKEVGQAASDAGGGLGKLGEESTQAAAGTKEVGQAAGEANEGVQSLGKESASAAGGIKEVGQSASEAKSGIASLSEEGTQAASGIKEVGEASKEAKGGMQEVGEEGAQASSGISKTGEAAKESHASLNELVNGVSNTISNYVQLIQIAGQVFSALAKSDDAARAAATAFTTLAGDAAKGNQALKDLDSSAAAHAYGDTNVEKVSVHLQLMGKTADQAQQEIALVADALAATGQDASQLEPAVDELDKLGQKSHITAQDIDDLAKTGIPAWQAIAEQSGMSIDEVRKRVQAGGITGHQAMTMITQDLSKYAGDAEDKGQSLDMEWQRLGHNLGEIFHPMTEMLAQSLDGWNSLMEGTNKFGDSIRGLLGPIQDAANALRALMSMGGGTVGGIGMPAYASGIMDSPVGHFATVGEEGPETMYIPQGASIIPNGTDPLSAIGGGASSALASVPSFGGMGGGAGGSLTVQLLVDSQMLAEQTVPHIASLMRVQFGVRR